ncbi:hypothetical protein AFK68_03400 [Hydrocoleum sp. CS-953]|nr:hypothetical protein AFK68_03400 [Hydrocoleum sp. CS-953]
MGIIIIKEIVGKIVPQFFCHNHPKILALCSSFHRKACTFFDLKRLKPLYVNTFRINQQTLLMAVAITGTDIIKFSNIFTARI